MVCNPSWEEFHTRKKVADPVAATGYMMISGMFFGLAEIITFPIAVCSTAEALVMGKTIRFEYDSEGQVIKANGKKAIVK